MGGGEPSFGFKHVKECSVSVFFLDFCHKPFPFDTEAGPRLCQNSVGQLPPPSFLGRTDGSAVTFDEISGPKLGSNMKQSETQIGWFLRHFHQTSQFENSEVSTNQVHLEELVLHGPKGGESAWPCIGYLSLDSRAHKHSQMHLDAPRSPGHNGSIGAWEVTSPKTLESGART